MNGILTILFKSRITRKTIFFEDALFSAKWHGTCATVNVSIETTKKKVKNKTNSKTVIKKFESVSSDRWQKTWINVRFTETRVVREYRISVSFFLSFFGDNFLCCNFALHFAAEAADDFLFRRSKKKRLSRLSSPHIKRYLMKVRRKKDQQLFQLLLPMLLLLLLLYLLLKNSLCLLN